MRKNKKQRRIMLLLILILSITIGFALLSTTLKINGTANIKSNTWNIHWDDTSVNVTSGSVSATDPIVSTTTSTKDTVSFDVELELPGDFYEFEIDAINEGSVDGALDLAENWITYKVENQETTLPEYMDFKVTYDDDTNPTTGDVLKASESKTYKIRVEFKSSVEELPSNPEPITIEVELPYVQHKEETSSPIILPTGKTKDTLEAGDEICITGSTTECFNFINYGGTNNEKIVMLAKYNLNVGPHPKGVETFRQDSDVVGKGSSNQEVVYGTVYFSQYPYWVNYNSSSYIIDVYDTTYNVEPDFSNQGFNTPGYSVAYYVERYKALLEADGIDIEEARLLTYDEVTSPEVGCTFVNGSGNCPSSYVTTTSYWLGTAYTYTSTSQVWFVHSAGFINTSSLNSDEYFGVRPVIVISKSNM